MSIEERFVKLEEFATDVRNFTKVSTEMMRRHDERMQPRRYSVIPEIVFKNRKGYIYF